MKRLIFKALLVVFVVLGLSHYALYLKTGRIPDWSMLWAINSQSLPNMSDIKARVKGIEEDLPLNQGAQTVYKWRDEHGNVNVSTEMPPSGLEYEKIELDGKISIIPSTPAAKSPVSSRQQLVPADDAMSTKELLTKPYTVDGVKELVQKSQDVQKQLNQRATQQNEILEKL